MQHFLPEDDDAVSTATFGDDEAFSPIFVRDGPHANAPFSADMLVDEQVGGIGGPDDGNEPTAGWIDGITNGPRRNQRYNGHKTEHQQTILDKFRGTVVGRNFYHFRYPIVIITVGLQVVYHVMAALSGVYFVNTTHFMINSSGAETIIYRGQPGDNTTKCVRSCCEGEAYVCVCVCVCDSVSEWVCVTVSDCV